jgi:hypothetical protein
MDVDLADRVELPAVPVGAVQRQDRAGVVQERARVAQPGVEPEPVRHVGPAVPVVVDVDLVADVVAELVEGRATRGLLERHVVGYQGHRARPVRADERVDVGAVGDRILGDLGRFTMGRHNHLTGFSRHIPNGCLS